MLLFLGVYTDDLEVWLCIIVTLQGLMILNILTFYDKR